MTTPPAIATMWHSFWTALWRPLPPGSEDATGATIGTGLLAIIATIFIHDSALRARAAISGIGCVMIVTGITRPRFAWRYDRGWRSLVGDRLYALSWIVIGGAFLFGAWVMHID